MSKVLFEIGEVISGYSDTYTNPDKKNKKEKIKPYSIRVKIIDTTTSRDRNIRTAIPYDINNLQVPVKGEQVLIIRGFKSKSKHDDFSSQWYYISSFSSNSSSNINSLVSISEQKLTEQQIELKRKNYKEITEKNISLLQLYPGDRVLSGRWGNTIRLGGTTKFNNNVIQSRLLGDTETQGDPVIILSNTKEHNDDKRFINENIKSDYSSLYLTSTQKLSEFTLNKSLEKIKPSESDFAKSQFIGVADRVILKAKSDIIVLDSEKSVVINTDELRLGDDAATESMVYGDILARLLTDLISTIRTGTSGGGLISIFDKPTQAKFNKLTKRIQDIKSNHKIK